MISTVEHTAFDNIFKKKRNGFLFDCRTSESKQQSTKKRTKNICFLVIKAYKGNQQQNLFYEQIKKNRNRLCRLANEKGN